MSDRAEELLEHGKVLDGNLTIYCRGRDSLKIAEDHGLKAELHPDLAFSMDYSPWECRGSGKLHAMRGDVESGTNYRPAGGINRDISLQSSGDWHPDSPITEIAALRFIGTIAAFAEVETDRLHVAIVAAKLGKKVRLIGSVDHKVREVYELSMREQFPNVEYVEAADTRRGIAPRSVIIWQSSKWDRNPKELREQLGNCAHFEAVCPDWDASRDNNAIRGCSISHVDAYRKHAHGRPVLVLEDDAVMVPAVYEDWLNIPELPDDCGAVLLGGDVRRYRRRKNGWIEVFDFCGTQAVVYNTPLLEKVPFLAEAYRWIASHKMGPHGAGKDSIGSCYEQVLWYALREVGLKVYCRENHAFTTRPNLVSTRSDLVMHQRALNIHQETPSHCGTPPKEE